MIARLREILAELSGQELRDGVYGAAILCALFWNLPLIAAVLDAVFGVAR